MLLVCTRICSYVTRNGTRMVLVYYSYVLVYTRMYSYVLVWCFSHDPKIGHYTNVRGLGKSMVVFRLFEKLRYSNERSTIF